MLIKESFKKYDMQYCRKASSNPSRAVMFTFGLILEGTSLSPPAMG